MNKTFILLLMLLCSFMACMSQELKVLKISHNPNDHTSHSITRTDMNNNKCALVIVNLDLPGAKFYGNVIGEVIREKGNYIVYMSSGSKKLQVQHNLVAPLRLNFADYGVPQIESGETYRISLDIPEEIRKAAQAGIGTDTKSPKHLSLFCTKDGQSYFFSKNEWKDLKDKDSYNKMGLVIIDREELFFIALEDYGEYTEQEISGYLQLLPTEEQIQAIIDDLSNVQDALEYFGGKKLAENYYMVNKYEDKLILGDTSFSWKFARELNTIRSQNRVRPASNRFQNTAGSPFNLPVSITFVRNEIREARKQKDYTKALELCLSIPDDTYAQYYLGLMYELGQGVDQDQAEAVKWYRKGAEQNDSDCQYEIGRRYQYGEGIEKDYSEAIKWYIQAADNGKGYAMAALGFMYLNGEGVDKNLDEAVKYISQAADRGISDAQNYLGWMYESGNGVTQNDNKAFELYQKAANNNHINAQVNLGYLYYKGKGTSVDFVQAFNWWMKAADQGNSTAQSNIGYLYKSGEGVQQDYGKAIEWYKKSANAGDAFGENNLGYMYLKGLGVSTNYDEALRLFRSAAEKGNSDALFSLGEMYENGQGVATSLNQAKEYYEKASAKGHEKATQALSRLNGAPLVYVPTELNPNDFDSVRPFVVKLFDEELSVFLVRKGNKSGVYSKYGLEIIPCKYDEIFWVSEFQAFVIKNDNKYGLISLGGEEIIPIVLESRPMPRIFRDLLPWYIETVYPTGGYDDVKNKNVILVTFDGTPFYSFKFKKFFDQKNLGKLIDTMNTKFKEADKKAGSRYSILGEDKKSALAKINALYFNVLQDESSLRKDAHNGDEKAINILRKVHVDKF